LYEGQFVSCNGTTRLEYSLFTGAAAGLRLRAFALFPLILIQIVVISISGLAQHQSGWSVIVMNFLGAGCLQLGCCGRHVGGFPHYRY
jgi:hypothetical protein